MKMKKESLMLGRLFKKLAPRIGARVHLEPEWGIVGRITFKSGRHSYFRYNTLDINSTGSADVARDKDYSNFFMSSLGYPTVPGSKTFFSDEWAEAIGSPRRKIDAAYRHARKLGFPVVVKPNSGSQGTAVSIVYNRQEFYEAMHAIFKKDRIALVQQVVGNRDYRLVVLDNKIISAYERFPLNVTGNGRHSIRKLLEKKQDQFHAVGRDTRIKVDDPRIRRKLRHQGLSLRSVPKKGKVVYLLDNANLSSGGDSIDVTRDVNPAFRKLAIKVTRNMGLRLCGVDLMVDGNISQKPRKYWILEINAAPGLDHYAKIGPEQEEVVERLYLEVLKHMER